MRVLKLKFQPDYPKLGGYGPVNSNIFVYMEKLSTTVIYSVLVMLHNVIYHIYTYIAICIVIVNESFCYSSDSDSTGELISAISLLIATAASWLSTIPM